MPRLIRTMARTAAIAGTATAVSNGVSRRQYGRWERKAQEEAAQQQAQQQQAPQQQAAPHQAQPPPAPAPTPPAGGGFDDRIEQLKKLAELKDAGILTEEEFAAQKAKLLG